MTQDNNKQFRVELEHEEKVINIGTYFYDLKGVLICEATEEDKEKYYCGRFMTFPIVDDDWRVVEDRCIIDGIELLIVGKKGDTILLESLHDALDENARVHNEGYDELLVSLERKGITITNRKDLNSADELSDTIVLFINKICMSNSIYSIRTWAGYYIPERLFVIGKDDELYQYVEDENGGNIFNRRIVDLIADDVSSLCWFFNKPNLRVLLTTSSGKFDGKVKPIPKDWFYTIQTLESDINRQIEAYNKKETRKFYKDKLPDNFVEKCTA